MRDRRWIERVHLENQKRDIPHRIVDVIEHGPKGAELALTYHAEGLLPASDALLDLLVTACRGHTVERTHADATIATCWDADRLDLPRVGITVDPAYLCTDAAKDATVIREAEARALKHL